MHKKIGPTYKSVLSIKSDKDYVRLSDIMHYALFSNNSMVLHQYVNFSMYQYILTFK